MISIYHILIQSISKYTRNNLCSQLPYLVSRVLFLFFGLELYQRNKKALDFIVSDFANLDDVDLFPTARHKVRSRGQHRMCSQLQTDEIS